MFVFYDWPFPHMYFAKNVANIVGKILGSVFSNCVVFYGDRHNTHPFNGPLSGTTQVSQYQKGKNQSGFY